jgi:hypothetical protein
MPTECSADLFGFAPAKVREVLAAFDAGAINLGCRIAAAGGGGSCDCDDGPVTTCGA